eukprot:SAG31_NODE_1265_length_9070_cov_5.167205_6_plen_51_part_00
MRRRKQHGDQNAFQRTDSLACYIVEYDERRHESEDKKHHKQHRSLQQNMP